MAKMTESTFATLFELGRQVYHGEIDIKAAAEQASSQRPEIVQSSARHYILWYSKMRAGEYLTWNSNSDLLLYYTRRIIEEEGADAGSLAIHAAKQFAKHVSRADLENNLNRLATENGISLVESQTQDHSQSQKDAFRLWLEKLENHKYTDSTIYKYTRALEMAEKWLSFELACPILSITTYTEFEECSQTIKALPNYAEVNQAHGHGDLSAALSLYSKFLIDQTNVTSAWWPTTEEYHPGLSKKKWIELLNNPVIFTESSLMMIAEFYAFGGEATCAQLAAHYHKTYNYYLMTSVHLAERVVKSTGCPVLKEEKNVQNAKWWPVLYIGKVAGKETKGTYIWKIRDELNEALTEFGIERYLSKSEESIRVGVFDSWEILEENTAIKHCDKSFFDYRGSGVPKSICWFFDAEDMALGETKSITLIYNGQRYQGSVKNESTDRRRVRIFWSAELSNLFNEFNIPGAVATFKKISNDTYEVSVIGGERKVTIKEKVAAIKTYIAAKGFKYEDGLIENFYLSLKSKPFVILAGTSGTGKTRLVKLFAEAVGATTANGRYKMVSVRPDWSDSSDLFGHVDLNGKFIPGAIIDFVKKAEIDNNYPYFLCLDEMNLARVEYYLSDILSVIETRDFVGGAIQSDPLISDTYYGSDASAAGRYGTVRLPENLYIIGTVNMDETTFPFSRKVLDRANTIEFSFVDLMPTFDTLPDETPQALNLSNAFLKTEYLLLNQCAVESETVTGYCIELQKVNRVLQKANAHVGYRVRDEIVFYLLNNKKHDLLSEDQAMDNELMQKILPRIQGSSASVKTMLCELFKFCASDYDGYQSQSNNISDKMRKALNDTDRKIKYRRSAEKIELMIRRFEEDGFTSYWL